jgi:hypothetical protein
MAHFKKVKIITLIRLRTDPGQSTDTTFMQLHYNLFRQSLKPWALPCVLYGTLRFNSSMGRKSVSFGIKSKLQVHIIAKAGSGQFMTTLTLMPE